MTETHADRLAALRVAGPDKGLARPLADERVTSVSELGNSDQVAVVYYNGSRTRFVILERTDAGVYNVSSVTIGKPGETPGYSSTCSQCRAARPGDLTTHRDHVAPAGYNRPLAHSGERFHLVAGTGPSPEPFGRQL